jgi:glycerol-3-phosphate acyltransferase PlsX
MGGDYAPEINIVGSKKALEQSPELHLILVGDKTLLEPLLEKEKLHNHPRLQVTHAEETISMEDHGAAVFRKKKRSSIQVGLELLKEGQGQAFLSAGNSGAVMAGSLLVLGRLPGVERPAIIVKLPTAESFVTILDAGANVDCKPSHLVQFARMGHVFCKVIDDIQKPRIALLSNGSETHKGNELTRESHELLKLSTELNYRGYIEGFDLFRGTADVVICDGFVGNVTLKLAEGLAEPARTWTEVCEH